MIKLYYHKTDGGAEYLTDKFIVCPNGEKEGIFKGANYVVRLDGEPELMTAINLELLQACKCAEADLWGLVSDFLDINIETSEEPQAKTIRELQEAIARAEGRE